MNSLILAKEENSIVEVYYENEDSESFSMGFIDSVSENYFGVKALDCFGNPLGYEVRRTSEVSIVKKYTEHTNKIKIFYDNYNDSFIEEYGFEKKLDNIMFEVVNRIFLKEDFVSLLIDGFDALIDGCIKSFNNNIIEFLMISQYGEEDGICFIDLKSI
ncbi:hypothetical protein VQ643_16180, partial [Pseudomonas sp. F1_0610]|uniref:hypothetical protein n=1 Tax=Pseudomonas sp. F1_0610 TaxID=3114284 RepID=UPI0039C13C10